MQQLSEASYKNPIARSLAREVRRPRSALKTAPAAIAAAAAGTEDDDGLLPQAIRITAAAYGAALAIAAITFAGNDEAFFAVIISMGLLLAYLTIPIILAHVRSTHDNRWLVNGAARTRAVVSIHTGTIRRGDALLQMVIVPLAVVAAFTAFGVIWTLLGP